MLFILQQSYFFRFSSLNWPYIPYKGTELPASKFIASSWILTQLLLHHCARLAHVDLACVLGFEGAHDLAHIFL